MKPIKRILPWLICIAIFYFLFQQIKPVEFWQALQLTQIDEFLFYSLAYFLIVWFLDSFALQHFLSRFATPVTTKEILKVRGVSYLFMIINYPLAQGVFAIYLKKTHNAKIAKTLGTIFFIMAADLLLVLLCGLIAVLFAKWPLPNFDLPKWAPIFILLLSLGYLFWIWFWRQIGKGRLIKWRHLKMVGWLLSHDIFLIFREAGLKDYLNLFLYRIPLLAMILGSFNLALFSFGTAIDWTELYLYNPIVMLIAMVPITPAGLGTGQYFIMLFYENLVSGPLLAAKAITAKNLLFTSSTIWTVMNQIYKTLFGMVIFLNSTRKNFKS